MSLRRNRLDDRALAELDALDAALRDEPVAPEHADVATLVADVRETAPRPTPAFLARLDERVREGFPPRDDAPSAPAAPPWWRRRPRAVAAGAVASLLLATVVAAGVLTSGEDTVMSLSTPQDDGEALSRGGADAPSAAAPAAETAPGTDRARSVERSASLDLTVASDDVQATADDVVRTTDRLGGIVQTSSIRVGEDSPGEARFELRVPSGRVDDALAAYSKLGSVANRTQDAQDITGAVASAESLLSDARAERQALLRALGKADTRREVESLRSRLKLVRADIARREAALRSVRSRADLATIEVTVRGDGDGGATGAGTGDRWSLGDAIRDAGRLLEVVAAALIVAGAALLPLLALGLAGAAAARILVRRRRERGLDAA